MSESIMSTVIVDLNQFVLANVPIMLILQFVPIFYLLNPDKTVLKVFPTAAVLDMMRGMAPSPVAVTFLVALIVAAAVVSVKAIQRLWRRAGGAKA